MAAWQGTLAANADIADSILGFHYDELLDAEPFDREATVGLVDAVGRWANHTLDSSMRS